MNKKIALITGLLASCLLASCVQVSQEAIAGNKKNNIAISSVRDIPINFPQGSKFALSPKYVKETSLKPEQTQAVYDLYANAIIGDLVSNGFKSTENTNAPAFHVGFGVALEDDLPDATLNEKFGVSPGLPKSEGLNKGSFLIYIEDSMTGKTVWRGAAQGFVHRESSESERVQRAEGIVRTVMAQFYATN
jgi:hypothetical protein